MIVFANIHKVPPVEQKLLTLPEHLSSPLVFSVVRVNRSLVLCVCFVDRCFSFFFWPLCVCPSSIYGFWLPVWYLQTLLNIKTVNKTIILCDLNVPTHFYIGWASINRFNPATIMCLSQARIWISNAICHGFFICT